MDIAFAAQQTNYTTSPVSSDDYKVTEILAGNKLSGCSALSVHEKPQMFLMLLTSGSGTVAINSAHFGLKTSESVSNTSVSVGRHREEKVYLVDGNAASFAFAKEELEAAVKYGLSINKVSVDKSLLSEMFAVDKKCLASSG